ncbi:hypothetical protein GU926_10075 [Nibribacter ruber]|uniref:DUF6799 domain-containing protein n=1 Tax=Nibribacter ruber TaxID=2698458 RepID=A0A6P1NV76_9BACT|nr:DUF6799 domain-containing protein [Nibribacter ruber]QHL87756.1 hypothetical protein GU926_10075 [Nibribacter ruber]
MKAVFYLLALLLAAVSLSPATALAQDSSTPQDTVLTRQNIKDNTIFWNQNRLVRHNKGELEPLDTPAKYPNGTTVSPEGKVRLPNGRTITLQLKQAVNPQGKIVLAADDLFTYTAIQEQERQVAGDTETRIVVINGQISSIKQSGKVTASNIGLQKQVELTQQLVSLLEQRSQLLEAAMAPADKEKAASQTRYLTNRIAAVERDLKQNAGNQ